MNQQGGGGEGLLGVLEGGGHGLGPGDGVPLGLPGGRLEEGVHGDGEMRDKTAVKVHHPTETPHLEGGGGWREIQDSLHFSRQGGGAGG